jgi:hypothetical protein
MSSFRDSRWRWAFCSAPLPRCKSTSRQAVEIRAARAKMDADVPDTSTIALIEQESLHGLFD